jgi:hypothetical protein
MSNGGTVAMIGGSHSFRRPRRLIVAGLTAIAALVATDTTATNPQAGAVTATTQRTLLILAGQSNASGLGSFVVDPATRTNYFAAPYTNSADARSKIEWEQSYISPGFSGGEEPLDTAQDLLPATILGYARVFGPEIGLARTIYADTGQPVTIVKVAFGATSLAYNWNATRSNGLFVYMVHTVEAVIAQDAQRGQTDTIGGFYWVQGENDAVTPSDASAYQANLTTFVTTLRLALPMPTAPIVLAKTSTTFPGNDEVRAADDWVATNFPDVVTVDTADLPRLGGYIHLNNTSELELGSRMATASGF